MDGSKGFMVGEKSMFKNRQTGIRIRGKDKINGKKKPRHLSPSVEQENGDKNRLSDISVPLRPSEKRERQTKTGPNRGMDGKK